MKKLLGTSVLVTVLAGWFGLVSPAGGSGGRQPDDAYAAAEAHVLASRFGEAAEVLERLVEASPDAWRAWAMLGFCRLKQRDFAGALEACARAGELKPDDMRAALWSAMSLEGLRRYAEATVAYAKLIETRPGRLVETECYWGLAMCAQALGKAGEADKHLQKVTQRDARRGRVLDAMLRMRRGDYAGARQRFERLYRADDEHPLVLYGLAVCCLKVNRDQEFALRLLEQVAGIPELDPNDVLLGRALALIRLARHAEARRLLATLDAKATLTPEQQKVRDEVVRAVERALGS